MPSGIYLGWIDVSAWRIGLIAAAIFELCPLLSCEFAGAKAKIFVASADHAAHEASANVNDARQEPFCIQLRVCESALPETSHWPQGRSISQLPSFPARRCEWSNAFSASRKPRRSAVHGGSTALDQGRQEDAIMRTGHSSPPDRLARTWPSFGGFHPTLPTLLARVWFHGAGRHLHATYRARQDVVPCSGWLE